MNSGPRSPTSLSSTSPPNNRQRLTKDLSISDLSDVQAQNRSQRSLKPTSFSNARTKKLKDHFNNAEGREEHKHEGEDREESVGNGTNFRSIDNSEQTEPTDNTTRHSRVGKKLQKVPTAKIIDDIIRTLEKKVQKKKKQEKRKSKTKKDNDTTNQPVSETPERGPSPRLQHPKTESSVKEKKRKIREKSRERIPKSPSTAERKKEAAAGVDSDAKTSNPTAGPEDLLKQRLKEKLAGSLERIEQLIDQRLSNRAERSANVLQTSDSDSVETIVSNDSSELVATTITSSTHSNTEDSKMPAHERHSNSQPDYAADCSTRSAHVLTKDHKDLSTKSPHTPNTSHRVNSKDGSKGTPKSEVTPSMSQTTPSRVALPDVYKSYTAKTKGLPLTSPTPYARTPRSNSSWKSPNPSDPRHRASDATPKGKQGPASLANFLDDIQDLLLDDLYSIGSSLDDRSNYSVPLTNIESYQPLKGSERSEGRDEESVDMLAHYCWSASSTPSATNRTQQARETFWDDYRKSRLPMSDRHIGTMLSRKIPGDRETKPSIGARRQSSCRGLHDELLAKHSLQDRAGRRKGPHEVDNADFLHKIQHELRRRKCETPK